MASGEVTLLLEQARGRLEALNRLARLTERALRSLARPDLACGPGHLLQTTALVNEAFLLV